MATTPIPDEHEAAVLEPKEGEVNGGEHHYIAFDIDTDNVLSLEVDAMCYGAHSTFFSINLPAIGPDELERFGNTLVVLAAEMRKRDAARE
jgi:hypothetical protein